MQTTRRGSLKSLHGDFPAGCRAFSEEEALAELAPLLERPGNIVHNGKALMHAARQWDVAMTRPFTT